MVSCFHLCSCSYYFSSKHRLLLLDVFWIIWQIQKVSALIKLSIWYATSEFVLLFVIYWKVFGGCLPLMLWPINVVELVLLLFFFVKTAVLWYVFSCFWILFSSSLISTITFFVKVHSSYWLVVVFWCAGSVGLVASGTYIDEML